MPKKVVAIPATKPRYATSSNAQERHLRRVAAYARVSTDLEEQTSSYETQIAYYTSYIQGRSDWVFAGMYSDEGISGTSTKHREGFQNMIQDALAGKIDLIITKSVSRFARNTVDSLTYVRTLKEKGIEIYFEKENIWTLDSKGELLITIMSSLAQEESRSISENVTWSHRKRFEAGKAIVPFGSILGFKKGEDGNLEIDEREAPTVRLIYQLVLEGLSLKQVKQELEGRGLKTAKGKDVWSISSIRSILTNEKYKGDALLQKTFTVDFLTKEKKKNEGEVPQYYVHNNHPAIVDTATWDEVQYILKTTLSSGRRSKQHFLSGRLSCGCCGGYFGSKLWHSTDKYRAVVWQCNSKYQESEPCGNRHVTEDMVQQAFVEALNKLLQRFGSQSLIKKALDEVFDVREVSQAIDEQKGLIARLNEELDKLLVEQQTAKLTADEFSSQAQRLDAQLHDAHSLLAIKQEELSALKAKRASISRAIKQMGEHLVTEFCPTYWMAFVEQATIFPDRIEFMMRLGGTISEPL